MTATQTEVTKKAVGGVPQEYSGLMDDTPVDVEDIIIPKLLLTQSQSGFFKDGKAKIGEIRGSLEVNLVAAVGQEVEFIPFGFFKTWVVLQAKGGKFVEEIKYSEATLEREETKDGVDLVNFQQINYYCLLAKDIATGVFMPYVVSFRSTSYTAGKALETKRQLFKEFDKPLCIKTFKLGSKHDKNEDGNEYEVFTVAEARDTTDAELKAVKMWNGIVRTKKVVVDDSDNKVDDAPKEKRVHVNKDDEF